MIPKTQKKSTFLKVKYCGTRKILGIYFISFIEFKKICELRKEIIIREQIEMKGKEDKMKRKIDLIKI